MNVTLTIQERLKDLRVEHGLTLEQLEKRTGISKSALGYYETDEHKDISHSSIVTLAKFYEVSTDYLLGLTENKNHPNTELSDLHLSDEMVELLQSGKINTRLLCEMAAHKDFVKLLADIEIYVDGLATMQIQNLNSWVDVVRAEITEKYHPDEYDKHTFLLKEAHINEREYFCNRIYEDINAIIADIKEAHKDDRTSAPDTSVADEIKRDLEEVANFNGSQLDKLLLLFCKQTKLKYHKLTDEEKQWLVRIAQKSELLKSTGRHQRKK